LLPVICVLGAVAVTLPDPCLCKPYCFPSSMLSTRWLWYIPRELRSYVNAVNMSVQYSLLKGTLEWDCYLFKLIYSREFTWAFDKPPLPLLKNCSLDFGFKFADIFDFQGFLLIQRICTVSFTEPWIHTVSFCAFGKCALIHSAYSMNMHCKNPVNGLPHSVCLAKAHQFILYIL
jgi:hypothetical protein